jgi:predicted component of viral defense system (DUF524 family)
LELPRGLARRTSQPDDAEQQFLVNFGDYTGLLCVANSEFLIESTKLDAKRFDQLLQEITNYCSTLPFDFNSPAFVPYERGALDDRDLLYHAYVYLRWAARTATPTLAELLSIVERDPHRVLTREEVDRPLWEVREVSPRALEHMCAHPEEWCVSGGGDGPRLPGLSRSKVLDKGFGLPAEVAQVEARATFDTPENRFVRYFIEVAAELINAVLDRLSVDAQNGTLLDSEMIEDANELRLELAEWARVGFLRDVSPMRYFPAASQVLQCRAGYRELLLHYVALTMASRYAVDPRDLQLILETKSASLLYEYWTFFYLADALSELVGRPAEARTLTVDDDVAVHLRQGVRLDYGDSIVLWYNRLFPGNLRGSYSLAFRPDITLQLGESLHFFDAKFRVDRFATPQDEEVDSDSESQTLEHASSGWFKKADIHKMHAYRDAIGCSTTKDGKRVSTVWVLYPGTECAFYDVTLGRLGPAEFSTGHSMTGVGALALVPGSANAQLTAVLKKLVSSYLA